MAQLLLLIHDKDSSTGTTEEWCRSRGVTFDLRVAEEFLDSLKRAKVKSFSYEGLIVFGGDMQVWETDKHPWLQNEKAFIKDTIRSDKPVLGLCLGGQLVTEQMGGEVRPNPEGCVIGWEKMRVLSADRNASAHVLSWHSSTLKPAPSAEVVAADERHVPQALKFSPKVFAFQFHLEIDEKRLAHALEGYDPNMKGRIQTPDELQTGLAHYKEELKSWYFKVLDLWWSAR